MNKGSLSFIYFLTIILTLGCHNHEKSNLYLMDDRKPTDSALIFAPGIISTEDYGFAITFNPAMDEMFTKSVTIKD